MTTNYNSFTDRVKKALTPQDVRALEKALDRLYNAGVLTVNEFTRLDAKLVRRSTEIQELKK